MKNQLKKKEINIFFASSEILSGIFVGVTIGYFLDKFFESQPWCLVVCLIFGFAGSMLNIYKMMSK